MVNGIYVSIIIGDFLYGSTLLLTFIHSCLILFIPRFRHRNNIFYLNMCFSLFGTSLFFTIYFTMQYFDVQRLYAAHMCRFLFYGYHIASVTVPFSFVTFTIHRFCSITYHTKPFFKGKQWFMICIGSQRIVESIIALPYLLKSFSVGIASLYISFE